MLDFFKSLFKPAPSSGETAKERLRLVLLSDHLSLAPEVIESLKRDLLAVISRYVEIDTDHADVTFEHREREIAMLASIPITGVRDRENAILPPVEPVSDAESEPAREPDLPVKTEPEAEVETAAKTEPAAEVEPAAQPELEDLPTPKARPDGVGRSRRRRKKYAAIVAAGAQTKHSVQAPLDGQASAQA
jgi:cell division topological specificity factor